MNLWEIETWTEATPEDPEGWLHSTIVSTDDEAPAGEVPAGVTRHAELLRSIAGRSTRVRVGWHTPCKVRNTGLSDHATTIWLTEWDTPSQAGRQLTER